jgi:hypothetical protein
MGTSEGPGSRGKEGQAGSALKKTGGFSTLFYGWRARGDDGVACPRGWGRRNYRWIAMGVLEAMFEALAREADLDWLMIDSTIVWAHQQAAGARRKKGSRMPRVLAAPAAV